MSEKRFLIYSHKWALVLQCPMWWRPQALGYTHSLKDAGRFSEAEAKRVSQYSGADSEVVEFGSRRFQVLNKNPHQKGENFDEENETD